MRTIARLALGFFVAASVAAQEAERRPNLLFLFSDDHATAAISAYGSNRNVTPNLDRLAAEGMLFENAFCGNSICAPSRATILTGLHSHANGHLDNTTTFDGSQTTFPKLLQGVGYQTAIVGKWHLRSDPTRVAWAQGSLLSSEPAEGLSIGRDDESSVSTRPGERPLSATIRTLRLVEGPVSDAWVREAFESGD